jgi:hypothetical protein
LTIAFQCASLKQWQGPEPGKRARRGATLGIPALKGALAAGRKRTGCQQNDEAENILKTKDVKPGFSQNEAENILKMGQLIEKRK